MFLDIRDRRPARGGAGQLLLSETKRRHRLHELGQAINAPSGKDTNQAD